MFPRFITKTILFLVVMSLLAMVLPHQTEACGPFFTDAIFVFEKHPEFPLERFARGQVGVLQPSYARSYLVAAYRNLSGQRLSDNEVNGLKALWEARINLGYDYSSDDWIKKWNEARAKVPGLAAAPEINAYRNREKPNDYETFLNCQQDAFDAATATLNDRIARFGNDSPVARDWVTTQDVVFSNCGGGEHIPEAASKDQDQVIRSARAYQIAAANFYATHYDEAAKQFDAIAKDASSPWQVIAPYLAARAMLRKGSLANKAEQQEAPLTEAEQRLDSILKDKSLARSHHAAARLLNLTRLRLRPDEKLHELADEIVHKDHAEDFKQAVWDYTVLIDREVGEDDEIKTESVPDEVRSDDLTDWILTFQDQSDAAATHALEQWHAKKTVPWFVAALAKSKDMAVATEFMNNSVRIDRGSPAFVSVVFHTARVLRETGLVEQARTFIDRTLAGDTKNWPHSAVNLLLHERLMLAQNLNEFLKAAQREPAGLSDNYDGREIPTDEKEAASDTNGAKLFFDADAAMVFNKLMPVGIALEAAQNNSLAANLRRDVAQATFMRAAILGQATTADKTAALLTTLTPELRELLTDYQRAPSPDARKFAAAFIALKYPGLRPFVSIGIGRTTALGDIDEYRDNWWCAEPPRTSKIDYYEGDEEEQKEASARKTMPAPEFLRGSQANAAREAAALQALGTGPNYLAQIVISWANKNPTDKRAPEALHLAVKSTRYGCTDADTGRWSKAAFDLLHRKYPNTSWAKETKYWFKG